MLLTPEFLRSVFAKALPCDEYLQTGTSEQRKRWQNVYRAIKLSDEQDELLINFVREMNILALSGIWCGDCAEQLPLLVRIASACPSINLRFFDRDAIPQLSDNLLINNGKRVPVALFMAEDFALCSIFGDRTLTRYRSMARKQLGPACSTGLIIPDVDELNQTLQDWLNECERVQLMLRLSARLREKHQD